MNVKTLSLCLKIIFIAAIALILGFIGFIIVQINLHPDQPVPIILSITFVMTLITFAVALAIFLIKINQRFEFKIFIGLVDKDAGKCLYSYEEATEIIDTVCLKYFQAYTLYSAQGRWMDPANNLVKENSIVCYVTGVSPDTILKAAEELKTAMNQESVLINGKKAIAFEYMKVF